MGDIRATEAEQAEEQDRRDEWARLEQEESGQPAEAPDPLESSDDADDNGVNGQGESSPDGSAAEKPADGEPSETPDPWADAPEHLRTAYQAQQAELERTKNHLQAQTGRLSAESRRAAELKAQLEAQAEKEPKAEEAPKLADEDRARLVEDYPDVAKPLLDEIGRLERIANQLVERDASREEQAANATQLELQRHLAEQEQLLAEKHSDWREVCAKPEFAAWVKAGPQFIRDGLARNGEGIVDAAEAAKIVDLFKIETAPAEDPTKLKREKQLSGSALPTTRIPASSSQKDTSNDREAEWKRQEAEEARLEKANR